MNTVTLPISILAGITPFMAKKDVRFYLNGALLTRSPAGLRVVATDGHALAVCDAPGFGPDASVIIPRDVVEWACKSRGELSLTWSDDKGDVDATNEKGESKRFRFIDGRFPDYLTAVPLLQPDRTEMAGFNPAILGLIDKATAGLGKHGATGRYPSVTLHGNGDGRAIGFELGGLLYGLTFLGVMMPLRDSMAPRSEFGLARERAPATPGPECESVARGVAA